MLLPPNLWEYDPSDHNSIVIVVAFQYWCVSGMFVQVFKLIFASSLKNTQLEWRSFYTTQYICEWVLDRSNSFYAI